MWFDAPSFLHCLKLPSRANLKLGRSCTFFFGLCCWSSCHPAHFGRLTFLFVADKNLFVLFHDYLSPCSKRARTFCASPVSEDTWPIASMLLTFLEQSTFVNVFLCYQCKSLLVMKLAASLHQFRYLAAFCIWLLRKCRSSSWPALLSSLLAAENPCGF